MNKGIHSRGYIPHWDFAKSVQAITFRLADSVPKQAILEWKNQIGSAGDDAFVQKELHRRIAKYEDAGHGETILEDNVCVALVQDNLVVNHGISYKLIAWVVMPNHVHVLIRLLDGHSIPPIVQRWKGASAIEINRHQNRCGTVWAPDYFDRFIRDENHLHDSIAYIRNNPVKAGLCSMPEEWPFSSAGMQWSADFSPPESPSDDQAD